MKKIFVVFLSFIIGVLAVYLLKFENQESTSIQTNYSPTPKPISYTQPSFTDDVISIKTVKETVPKPFFDSFDKDEAYNSWLIADDFKGMQEVWTILLDQDFVESKDKNFIWQAMILTKHKDDTPNDDADFSSVWIKTEKNRLSFKTKKYRNVEYKFVGEFFKNGKDFAQEEKVLKGTLQKFIKGKKVAEFTSDFAYYEPHCIH
jgi:hypothetical protein